MGLGAEMAREGYEASVISRMTERAGTYSPKGSAGNTLEIMANDKSNLGNLFKPDTITRLTKFSIATQEDTVTTKAGKVIERIQYKDIVRRQESISRHSFVEQSKQQRSIMLQQKQVVCQRL